MFNLSIFYLLSISVIFLCHLLGCLIILQLRGRQLEVIFAQEKRKTPNEMRGRGDRGRER